MSWYPWSISDDAVGFVEDQFQRFGAPLPANKVLDQGISFVIEFVAKNDYFPQWGAAESLRRYRHPGMGLTEPEKYTILGPLEYFIKIKVGIRDVSVDQLHLLVWSTLLFCWSEKGAEDVEWFKRNEIGEAIRAPFSLR
jgi:hypothetical protein